MKNDYSFFLYMFEKIEFVASAFSISDIPKEPLREVVLCGRSNVGKSSFINSIFSRKNLAKISSTPGKTRSLNYYLVDEKFYVVDIPGFGFANVPKAETEKWAKLVDGYFHSGRRIVLALHLIDSRHEPAKLDLKLNAYLKELGINYAFILNKIDKLKQSELSSAKKNIVAAFPEAAGQTAVFQHSAVKGTGKKEILGFIRGAISESNI